MTIRVSEYEVQILLPVTIRVSENGVQILLPVTIRVSEYKVQISHCEATPAIGAPTHDAHLAGAGMGEEERRGEKRRGKGQGPV